MTDQNGAPEAKRVARTVADAVEGDWLWHLDQDKSRYDAAGKYVGRGVRELRQVAKVGRQSVQLASDYRDTKYDRATGIQRGNKYGYPLTVQGSEERTASWWRGSASELSALVSRCKDLDRLKAVAFIFGFDGPPDFTVDHALPSSRENDAEMEDRR